MPVWKAEISATAATREELVEALQKAARDLAKLEDAISLAPGDGPAYSGKIVTKPK